MPEYKRLSELPAVDTLADLALVPVVQGGANYRATVGQLRAGLAVDGHSHAAASQSAAGFMAATDKAKLDGIAANATRNDSDASLRDRTSHTGTQAIATVDGLPAALDGKAPATHGHPAAAITGLAAVATSGDYADLVNVPAGGGTGGPAAFRNLIVNGGCAVSHRSPKTLSNGWQVAEADLIAVKADGSIGGYLWSPGGDRHAPAVPPGSAGSSGRRRLRKESLRSSIRTALWTIRSRMASARVGSPMISCQRSTGTWLVISREPAL